MRQAAELAVNQALAQPSDWLQDRPGVLADLMFPTAQRDIIWTVLWYSSRRVHGLAPQNAHGNVSAHIFIVIVFASVLQVVEASRRAWRPRLQVLAALVASALEHERRPTALTTSKLKIRFTYVWPLFFHHKLTAGDWGLTEASSSPRRGLFGQPFVAYCQGLALAHAA
jgi:hypothetical protein